MNEKKPFTFKYEKSDAVLSTPRTPVKKVPYKDIFSTPTRPQDPPQFYRLISKGDFFEVYLKRRIKEEDKNYDTNLSINYHYTAVKKSINILRNDLEKVSALREVEFLKQINSEYVIKYINSWILNQYIYIEVEYCSYGTLREYMNFVYYEKKSFFSKEIRNKILKEIALGLEAIHKHKIVHLDLKPENIFLSRVGNGECGRYVNRDISLCMDKGSSRNNSLSRDYSLSRDLETDDLSRDNSLGRDISLGRDKGSSRDNRLSRDLETDDLGRDNSLSRDKGISEQVDRDPHLNTDNSYSPTYLPPLLLDPSQFTLKIGDFNISRLENEEIGMDGDKKYMAPEVLDGICNRKSDVFSLGLIYLEILNEIILPTSGEKWINLRRGNLKGMKTEGPMRKMLMKDYKKRIDISKVLDYFK